MRAGDIIKERLSLFPRTLLLLAYSPSNGIMLAKDESNGTVSLIHTDAFTVIVKADRQSREKAKLGMTIESLIDGGFLRWYFGDQLVTTTWWDRVRLTLWQWLGRSST